MFEQISWTQFRNLWECESIESTFRESLRCCFRSCQRIWREGWHSIFQARNSLVWAGFSTLLKPLVTLTFNYRSFLQDRKACKSFVVKRTWPHNWGDTRLQSGSLWSLNVFALLYRLIWPPCAHYVSGTGRLMRRITFIILCTMIPPIRSVQTHHPLCQYSASVHDWL